MFLDLVMGRKSQVGLTLSPRAIAVLDALAEQTDSSRTEVVEAIAQAQLALLVDQPKWAFQLIPGEEKTTVQSQSTSSSPTADFHTEPEAHAPRSHETDEAPDNSASASASVAASPAASTSTTAAPAPEDDHHTQQLEQEKASLQAQLQQAREEIQQLKQQASTAEPQSAQATATHPLVAAVNDSAANLRESLTKVKMAYAELEQKYQEQQAENDQLRHSLSQLQQVASIGEAQINRWQYKTFSR